MKTITILLFILMLFACGEGTIEVDTSVIEKASSAQIEALTAGLVRGVTISNVYAQKLRFQQIESYAIAAELRGEGVNEKDNIAVWLVRGKDIVGNIINESKNAKLFSNHVTQKIVIIPPAVNKNITGYLIQKMYE